jgi:hypothetical protein
MTAQGGKGAYRCRPGEGPESHQPLRLAVTWVTACVRRHGEKPQSNAREAFLKALATALRSPVPSH